ncbi:hypothetical protein ACFUIZ_19700 [Streptomyces cinereoruber]|uniref:hypothetical protein n=1 Tax=Streptomyces cinereoruber TaxID=67260 RepID=UPI00363E57E0
MGRMVLRKEVNLLAWRSPATAEAAHASATTPAGDVVLTRGPGSRTRPEAAAESWENWIFSLRGEPRMEVHGLGAPGALSRKLLGRGIAGTFDGEAFKVSVSSAFAPSKRSVDIAGTTVDIAFKVAGLNIHLLQKGECRGVRNAGKWDISVPDDAAALSACLFEWADMDHFLRMPGLRLL